MIKIMQVLSDTNIGGAGKWLINVLKHIDRKEFNVIVAIPEGSLLKKEIEKLNIEIFEIPGKGDCSFSINAIKYLYNVLKKYKVDIIHSHASMSARIAGRLAGIKSIVYTRHCMGRKIEGNFGKLLSRLINKGLSDRVIAVSQSVRENLVLSGIPADMIELVYNGIETLSQASEADKQRIREYWGIKSDEIVVGIIARLEEIKGHNIFLRAACQVIKENIPVKFIIVGSGSLEKELKDLTKKLEIDDKIIFTGHLQNVSDVMNIIDINVLSSFSEALSLSLIEAMSLGKPCIATKTGGNPEVITDGYNGMLVPVKDVNALANAMIKLIKDENLREVIGERGKETMLEKFTVENMINGLQDVYRTLIKN